MALRWDWNEKIGEADYTQDGRDWKVTLYNGNAFLIMLNEWEEDGKKYWQMHSFWVDKEHMNRMLGLASGYSENLYETEDYRFRKFRISKKCRNFKTITSAILKAFEHIEIETY